MICHSVLSRGERLDTVVTQHNSNSNNGAKDEKVGTPTKITDRYIKIQIMARMAHSLNVNGAF